MAPYFVYRLISTSSYNYTFHYHYIGSTPNPKKRIRQHNGFIVGGAKCTSLKLNRIICDVNTSLKWNYEWLLMTFLNKNNALSVEWHLKYPFNVRSTSIKKTIYNVNLNGEIFKHRCNRYDNDINIMLKQIDVTIQYVIEKNNIIGNDQQMFMFIDYLYYDNIIYNPLNFKIFYFKFFNQNILNNLIDQFIVLK